MRTNRRDIIPVVVPWIDRRDCNTSANTAAAATDNEEEQQQCKSTTATRHFKSKSRASILRLLSARERIGMHHSRVVVGAAAGNSGGGNTNTANRAGWLSEGVIVTTESLAGRAAWNVRRMQNMTLAIGPGTPASCVLPAMASSSDEEDHEDDDDDNDDHDDDGDVHSFSDDSAEEMQVDDRVIQLHDSNDDNEDNHNHDNDDDEGVAEEVMRDDDNDTTYNNNNNDNDNDVQQGQSNNDEDSSSSSSSSNSNIERRNVAGEVAARERAMAREVARAILTGATAGANTTTAAATTTINSHGDNRNGEGADATAVAGVARRHREEKEQWNQRRDSTRRPPDGSTRRLRWMTRHQNDSDDDHVDTNSSSSDNNNNTNENGNDDNDNDDNSVYSFSEEEEEEEEQQQHEIHRAEQYLESIQNRILRHHRHRHRDRQRERERNSHSLPAALRNNDHPLLLSQNDDLGQEMMMNEREVARSMKHGGCINTACWLDTNWRISTVSHEDAGSIHDYYCNNEFITSSSYSSNNYNYNNGNTDNHNSGSNNTMGPCSAPRQRQPPQYGAFVTPTPTNEYPTQLLTSGDDHLLKFWDVSQSMGSTSPLPGGSATLTPFSSPRVAMKPTSELISSWKQHAGAGGGGGCRGDNNSSHRNNANLPGIVHPLLTLPTGHRGNIFHASPVPHRPGKVATCAADGYLRLIDIELQSASSSSPAIHRARSNSTSSASNTGDASAIIISPEYQNENGESESSLRFHHSLMCFSHHFMNSNVGLVCSERGLLHFDLRLPARSQKRGSLVQELARTCKACKVWNAYDSMGEEGDGGEELESAYVFAGGSGCEVALYDLRMTGSYSSQAVQRFRPRSLRGKSSSVSVSGIDLSRDKTELLISYENDQIYTFPVFPNASSAAGPTLSDTNSPSSDEGDGINDTEMPISELAAYGGHLNRLTFLKSAKYAGPNDEYICTGSDSGHAWIYEKSTGAVVSFLKADNSTCNGIVPHPKLPYFITYGIDSTAKLWRATNPVGIDVDDTDLGRFAYSQKSEYQKSIIVDQWKSALRRKPVDLDDEDLSFFPDEIPSIEEDSEESFFSGLGLLFVRARFGSMGVAPFIGNDLMKLNLALTQNYFTCARSSLTGEEAPVKSGLAGLKQRVSLIRLRHQADTMGLAWDSRAPWIIKPKAHLLQLLTKYGIGGATAVSYGSLADLIPNNPSDWIPFDAFLSNPSQTGGMVFNTKDHERFYLDAYKDHSIIHVDRASFIEADSDDFAMQVDAANGDHENAKKTEITKTPNNQTYESTRAWDILYKTVSILKEAGNDALRGSQPFLAARRYDKAINYCSIAYLEFQVGNVDFLAEHQVAISDNDGYECRWNPLLKLLIQIRLNLSMCFLKDEMKDVKSAKNQANFSLRELKPFATKKGVVFTGKKLDKERTDEPHTTYTESKALQSKAYFRLGSAQMLMGDFDDAIKCFEQSVKSTKATGDKPDKVVLRKLSEAKKGCHQKKERQKRKFKLMFGSSINENKDTSGDCENGSEAAAS